MWSVIFNIALGADSDVELRNLITFWDDLMANHAQEIKMPGSAHWFMTTVPKIKRPRNVILGIDDESDSDTESMNVDANISSTARIEEVPDAAEPLLDNAPLDGKFTECLSQRYKY